jgi:hypothetical protein
MTAPEAAVSVVPAYEVGCGDLRTLFGTRGAASWCQCQRGLVAYLDVEQVGWCAVESRTAYEGLLRVFRVPWEGVGTRTRLTTRYGR